ncbi:MAG: hypothetical protein J6A36_02010 [Clostridia bacterium]|nr:hypothetical protein [Clostridia bacterium]
MDDNKIPNKKTNFGISTIQSIAMRNTDKLQEMMRMAKDFYGMTNGTKEENAQNFHKEYDKEQKKLKNKNINQNDGPQK